MRVIPTGTGHSSLQPLKSYLSRVAVSCSAFRLLISRCLPLYDMTNDGNGDFLLKRIVVAVDGSVHSEKALDQAILLAKAFGSEMQIIHAIRHVDITKTIISQTFSSKAALTSAELYEELKKEASKWIEKYEVKAKAAGVVEVTTRILAEVGKSEVQMLTEYADSVKADMIVIGSRGLGTFKRLVLGSVASGAVSHALCPVFVVR